MKMERGYRGLPAANTDKYGFLSAIISVAKHLRLSAFNKLMQKT